MFVAEVDCFITHCLICTKTICAQGSLDDQVVEETGPEAVDWLKRRRRRKRGAPRVKRALNNMPPEMEGKGGVSAKGIFL